MQDPEAVAGNAQVRKIRPSRRSCTGYYISRAGKQYPFESTLERDFLNLADYDPGILAFFPQAVRVGRSVPDFKVETTAGTVIVEAKPEAILVAKWHKYADQFQQIEDFCVHEGFAYAFFTDVIRRSHQNRLTVLREINYFARDSIVDDARKITLLSEINGDSSTVRGLAEARDPAGTKALTRTVARLVFEGLLILVDTPSPFLEDAIVCLPKATPLPMSTTLSYQTMVKRIQFHPLRFLGASSVSYSAGMKSIELQGHKYSVLDATRSERVRMVSEENKETYEVSLDRVTAPGGGLTLFSLQASKPEQYDETIRRLETVSSLSVLGRVSDTEANRVAATLGVSKRQLRRYLQAFRNNGPSGLIPSHRRGGTGISRVEARADNIMKKLLEDQYLTPAKPKLTAVYRELKLAITNLDDALPSTERIGLPSYATFRRRAMALPTYRRTVRQEGLKVASDEFGVYGGSLPGAEHPLSTVEVDHTRFDVRVVDESGRAFARAWLTLMMDVFSRGICGFWLNFDQPNSNDVGLVILQCAVPKDEFVEKYGMKEWPITGVPAMLHTDNGKDFTSRTILSGCVANGIQVLRRPTYTPRFGGHIERLVRTFQEGLAHNLPGTTKSSPKERGILNPDLEATLTIYDLDAQVASFIDEYHHTPHSELKMTPLEKWEEGVERYGRPRQLGAEDVEKFRVSFLPLCIRTIQKSGIELENMTYYSDRIPMIRRTMRKGESLVVRYDPRDMGSIYVFHKERSEYYSIPSRSPTTERLSLRAWRASHKDLVDRGHKRPSESLVLENWRKRKAALEALEAPKSKRDVKEKERARRDDQILRDTPGARISKPSHDATEMDYLPSRRDLTGKIVDRED